jgi:TPR repeat protein
MDGNFYRELVSIVAKINHSRPYLTFIDNLNRERGKEGGRLPSVDSYRPEQKKAKHTQKFEKLQFEEPQWEMVVELFSLIAEYHKHTAKIIIRNSKKAKLKRSETYLSMVDVLARIFSYDMNLSQKGVKSNAQEFIDALHYYLKKNDDDITWDLLQKYVFKDAIEKSVVAVFCQES